MSAFPSIFVSYSGRNEQDKAFARKILARLKEQALSPWVFERRGSEIPPTEHIDTFCRKQIRQADHFVALISDASLESEATQGEVHYAITTFGAGSIIQVVTTSQAASVWPDPYATLKSYKQIVVRRDQEFDLERAVEDICKLAEVEYRPPNNGSLRLPLVLRLSAEMNLAVAADRQYEIDSYTELRQVAMVASNAYGEGRLEDAFSALDALDFNLKIKFPRHGFYYPRLIRAVLLLELAARRQGYLEQASTLLQEMQADASIAPMIDENWYAALATVHLRSADPYMAMKLFLLAHDIVTQRGQVDPDILHNIVVCHMVGATQPRSSIQTVLAAAMDISVTSDLYLYERVLALKASLCAKDGDIAGAQQILALIKDPANLPVDVLGRLAQDLSCRPELLENREMRRFVEGMFRLIIPLVSTDERSGALLSLAGMLYSTGRFREALETIDAIPDVARLHPRIVVERIWCLKQLGMSVEARECARNAADLRRPLDRQAAPRGVCDFLYYRGFAAWLVGRTDQAECDFLDSSFPSELSYQAVARRHELPIAKSRLRGVLSRHGRLLS